MGEIDVALFILDDGGKRLPERAVREGVAAVDVAGPGFINMRLDAAFWHNALVLITASGTRYGAFDTGRGKKVYV